MVRLRLDEFEVDIEGVPTGRYRRPGVLPVATQVHAERLASWDRSEDSSHRVCYGVGLHSSTPTAPGLGENQSRLTSREKVLYALDHPRNILSASSPDNRNTFGEPRPETGGPLGREVIVLGQVPRYPRVMEEVPPTAAQRPGDDCGIHHREMVGADQEGAVALLHQGPVSCPNTRHVPDTVSHEDAQNERSGKNPEEGGQTTHFALNRVGSPSPEGKPCQKASLRKASPG